MTVACLPMLGGALIGVLLTLVFGAIAYTLLKT